MATPAGTGSHSPFPVAPADVPIAAVRAVKRTLLRGLGADYPDIEDPMDDELARLVVAVVIAALAEPSPQQAAQPEHESCDATVWDGAYQMRCGQTIVNGRCGRHGLRPARALS